MNHIEPYTIEMLYAIVQARKAAPTSASYASHLFEQGTAVIAEKLGQEALETVIQAIQRNPLRLAEESADLLYHLMVLWADAGIGPADVYNVLSQRISQQTVKSQAA